MKEIRPAKSKTPEYLTQLLLDALTEARKTKCRAIAVIMETASGDCYIAKDLGTQGSFSHMMACCDMLKKDIMDEFDDPDN